MKVSAMLSVNQMLYVLDFFAGSGRFGELLLKQKDRLDFANAKVFPAEAKDCDFRWSCSSVVYPNNGWLSFESLVHSELNRGGFACLMWECDFRRSDPCIRRAKDPMVFLDDEVFYLLDAANADSQIAETMNRANKFFLMCMFRVNCCDVLHVGGNMTHEQLCKIVHSTVAVGVGIFDAEGVCYIPSRRQ